MILPDRVPIFLDVAINGKKNQLIYLIIHCSIFSYSHWSRAYVEFSVFLSWREHMTNKSRTCHVLTPSETNTRFICHVLTPSELFVMFKQVSAMAFARFEQTNRANTTGSPISGCTCCLHLLSYSSASICHASFQSKSITASSPDKYMSMV